MAVQIIHFVSLVALGARERPPGAAWTTGAARIARPRGETWENHRMSHKNRIRPVQARPSHRAGGVAAAAAVLAVALGACTQQQEAPPAPEAPAPEGADVSKTTHRSTLAPPAQAQGAFTYDPAAAPAGAEMAVTTEQKGQTTTVNLEVSGLQPNRGYASHAHVKPCGPTGDDAGPHFQNRVDPAATPDKPSTDPAYANPQNEIWLDVQTDQRGAGTATAEVPFVFTDRAPASVVIHEHPRTATEPSKAGTAGGRLACLSLPEN